MKTRKSLITILFAMLLSVVNVHVMATDNPSPEEPSYNESNGGYQISSMAELFWFANQVNSGSTDINACLTADIDFLDYFHCSLASEWLFEGSEYIDFNNQEEDGSIDWTPIGTSENPYKGTFDGQGHTIQYFCFAPNHPDHGPLDVFGLFGYTNGATIRRLNMQTCGSYANGSAGIFVAEAAGSTTIELCMAKDVIIHSEFGEGTSYIGGIVGRLLDNSIVQNCLVTDIQVAKNPTHTGGLVGYMDGGTTLENNYVREYVDLPEDAAIFGEKPQSGGTVTSCFFLTDDAFLSGTESGAYRSTRNMERSGACCLLLNGGETGDPEWGQKLGDSDITYPMPKGEGVIAEDERVYVVGMMTFLFYNKDINGNDVYNYTMISEDLPITRYNEGANFPVRVEQLFQKVEYYRTVTPGVFWHTLWLPFAVKASEVGWSNKLFVMSEEQHLETGAICLDPVDVLPAWTPGFLYKGTADEDYIRITAENAVVTNVVEGESDTVSVESIKYIASCASASDMTTLAASENTVNMFLSGDAIWIDSQKKVIGYPYRCYWNVPVSGGGDGGPIGPYGAAPFRLEINDAIDVDLVSSGICTLEEEKARKTPSLFDLSGRKLEDKPRGLFINNQKKVLVR